MNDHLDSYKSKIHRTPSFQQSDQEFTTPFQSTVNYKAAANHRSHHKASNVEPMKRSSEISATITLGLYDSTSHPDTKLSA